MTHHRCPCYCFNKLLKSISMKCCEILIFSPPGWAQRTYNVTLHQVLSMIGVRMCVRAGIEPGLELAQWQSQWKSVCNSGIVRVLASEGWFSYLYHESAWTPSHCAKVSLEVCQLDNILQKNRANVIKYSKNKNVWPPVQHSSRSTVSLPVLLLKFIIRVSKIDMGLLGKCEKSAPSQAFRCTCFNA